MKKLLSQILAVAVLPAAVFAITPVEPQPPPEPVVVTPPPAPDTSTTDGTDTTEQVTLSTENVQPEQPNKGESVNVTPDAATTILSNENLETDLKVNDVDADVAPTDAFTS